MEDGRGSHSGRGTVAVESRVAGEGSEMTAIGVQDVVIKDGPLRCEVRDLGDDGDDVSEMDITMPSRVETGNTLVGDEIEGGDGEEKVCEVVK